MLNRSLLRAVEGVLSFRERIERTRDPVVSESVERQSGETKQMTRLWMAVEWLNDQVRRFHESLADALNKPATLQRFVTLQRMLKGRIRPPTMEYYERVLGENPGALFDPVMGLDIETLRAEFKDLRKRTRLEPSRSHSHRRAVEACEPRPCRTPGAGLRPEEWLALERRDVDRASRVLHVRHVYLGGQVHERRRRRDPCRGSYRCASGYSTRSTSCLRASTRPSCSPASAADT